MSEPATRNDQQPTASSYPGWRYDWERETAAYEKVREQLVRDHLGKFVLVHQHEVVGVFNTPDEAIIEGGTRFGDDFVMVKEIRASEESEYIGSIDVTHPSFRRIDCHGQEIPMSEPATRNDQQPRPPLPPGWQYDFYREQAAYEKVREQLVRDHLGKVVLIHKDEVIGVFDDPNDGIIAARTRFGNEHVMLREICLSDEPAYIASVDITHPSFWRID